eukprot:gene2701-16136_t
MLKRVTALEQQNSDISTMVTTLKKSLSGTKARLDKLGAKKGGGGGGAAKAAPAKPKVNFDEWMKTLPTSPEGWTNNIVRKTFNDFFVNFHEHTFVPSSRTIPHDDPTLLFANAGMNQYKPLFLGTADPNTPLGKLTAAVNSQKCIRAGGKHNDLEDVGKDVYHHTFFEMLGNWSFNNTFFKEGAITMAWTLFTKVWGLEPDRLYVTYFEGDEADGVPADTEARDMWLKYLPAERVLPGNKADNFWEMGDTGPCGPCSEIHYDRIGGRSVPELVNMDDPDVLELWNLVFMQFNRTSEGLRPLPSVHVDTGLGLERVTSVLQNKRSNYDTDAFQCYFEAIKAGTKASRAYGGKVGDEDEGGIDMAYRVLADHIRTLTLAIVDGGMPDNVGRGYVLRLILRRAIRYGDEKLGAPPGFFPQMAKVVQANLGDHFTELTDEKIAYVIEILTEEEMQFRKTLSRGTKLFTKEAAKVEGGVLSGKVAWRLHDTYGFPLDLTIVMAEECKPPITVNIEEYNEEKAKAKLISQGGGDASVQKIDLDVNAIGDMTAASVPATNDDAKYDYDGSYSHGTLKAKVLKIRAHGDVCGVFADGVEGDDVPAGIVLDATNFYAEKGGQLYDTGYFLTAGGDEFTVTSVKSCGPYVLHIGALQSGAIKVGDEVELKMDTDRRRPLMSNHTATHILNYGLRQVLGEADQKGSLVEPDKLRFDFTARKALTTEQLAAVEVETRKAIDAGYPVYEKEVPLADAMEIQGLRAMFGEKYPDPVKMISIGAEINALVSNPKSGEATKYSVEFCGGTHVRNGKDCGSFAIIQETAVAKGCRRVECFTGAAADRAIARADEVEKMINPSLTSAEIVAIEKELLEGGATPQVRRVDIVAQLGALKKKHLAAGKALEKEYAKVANARAAEIVDEKPKLVVEEIKVHGSAKALNSASQLIKKKSKETTLMFFSVNEADGAIQCYCIVPKGVNKATGLSAKEWVGEVGSIIGGKVGGSDEVAQCRGDQAAKLTEAIELATKYATAKLG